MLAGWARLKYPHLFHAAVSSSSPLQAQLDFPEYAEVMRDSLATEEDGVGGSEECASAVETGRCYAVQCGRRCGRWCYRSLRWALAVDAWVGRACPAGAMSDSGGCTGLQ